MATTLVLFLGGGWFWGAVVIPNVIIQNAEAVNPINCPEKYAFQILIMRYDSQGKSYDPIGRRERRAMLEMLKEISDDIYKEGVVEGHFRPKEKKA